MDFRNILIVAATVEEIRDLFPELSMHTGYAGNIVHHAYGEMKIDILITGPGMVPTAFFLGQWLGVNHYDLAINAGIAGSFSSNLKIGDVVQVTCDSFPELGADDTETFIPLTGMSMANDYMPGFMDKAGEIHNRSAVSVPALDELPVVRGITVNTVSGDPGRIEALARRTGADVETMEGAAFFYACHAIDVPHLQIRAVSNHVAPRIMQKWDSGLAIRNLNTTLKNIIDGL